MTTLIERAQQAERRLRSLSDGAFRKTLGETLGGAADLLSELVKEIEALRERLEIGYYFDAAGNRVEVPTDSGPDGIECRDETIKLQDRHIDELRAENKALKHDIERHIKIASEYAADAERYRWARGIGIATHPDGQWLHGHALDTAIDAAMQK